MSIKHRLRMQLRRLGIEVSRYNAAQSQEAKLLRMLAANRIDTVLDVGANDGGYARSLIEGGFPGAILSFEPLASAHSALQTHAEGHAHWQVAPRMALGSSAGEADINVAGNSTSSSILPMNPRHLESAPHSRYVGSERVPLARLDGVPHPVISHACNIHLKVDTQGFEMPVLDGSVGLLPRVKGLQLEMSLVPLYAGQVLFRELYDWVVEKGFELHGVVPGFMDQVSGRTLQLDGIFFRP